MIRALQEEVSSVIISSVMAIINPLNVTVNLKRFSLS